MKRQLDIFTEASGPAAAEGVEKPPRRKRGAPKHPREVKKAPMLVDSFEPERAAPPPPAVMEALEAPVSQVEVEAPAQVEAEVKVEEAKAPKVLSVSELTQLIKGHLESSFTDVWVSGEVTDFRGRNGKHLYFALKDETSKIRAIIFGAAGRPLPFELVDGLKLICRGRLNVYPPSGGYSLIVDPEHCEPEGIGALKLAFEQLKKRLEAEGLFAASRKRPIPSLPRRIGIITAPAGAAIRDLIHVLTRRFPNIEVLLHPVRVQGEGAAAEIAEAIAAMNARDDLDVLIVGRGGGSMEDLWAFNEEVVARAITASRLPVISAVGHEIDFTIADFVADLRAATPSAAAELAVPVRDDLLREIVGERERLSLALARALERGGQELARLEGRLADPRKRLPDLLQRLDGLRERLSYGLRVGMESRTQYLAKLASNLDHLSPLGVLAKGYAVVEGPDGRAVTTAASLKVGDDLNMRFREGSAQARVTKLSSTK